MAMQKARHGSKRAAQAARSSAAKKGWETRRHNLAILEKQRKKRSEAAKKGWETRRRNLEEQRKKRSEAAKKGWKTRRRKLQIKLVAVTSIEQWLDNRSAWEDAYGIEIEEWESTADYEET